MRYEVPQFIDVEDKVFGPLSFRQFAYLVGGGGFCYIAYKFLPFYFAWPVIIAFGGLALALAFIKVNNRPLINVIEAAFYYFVKTKLYLWKKEEKKKEEKKEEVKVPQYVPRISESKLHDIAWGLDVLNKDAQQK